MPTCPKGHDSQANDYCDFCGTPIAGAPAVSGPAGTSTGQPPAATPSAGDPRDSIDAERACPAGHSQPSGRFCEVCGHDFLIVALGGGADDSAGHAAAEASADGDADADPAGHRPAPSPPMQKPATTALGFVIVAAADRTYFETVRALGGEDADAVTFPAFSPQRRFPLRGDQMLIGRRSRSRGIEPDIDLSGQPEDPGVSHAHAMLIAQPDGAWALVDVGSANGTFVNGGADPIAEHVPVPLADGDRIHVGAWTTLTVTAVSV